MYIFPNHPIGNFITILIIWIIGTIISAGTYKNYTDNEIVPMIGSLFWPLRIVIRIIAIIGSFLFNIGIKLHNFNIFKYPDLEFGSNYFWLFISIILLIAWILSIFIHS